MRNDSYDNDDNNKEEIWYDTLLEVHSMWILLSHG